MKKFSFLLFFFGVFSFSGLVQAADLDCEVRLIHEIKPRKITTIYEKSIFLSSSDENDLKRCFAFGRDVYEAAIGLYCEAGEHSVPCQESKETIWASIEADRKGWVKFNATKISVDFCGLEELEIALEESGQEVPNHLKRCEFRRDSTRHLKEALNEEIRYFESQWAREKR